MTPDQFCSMGQRYFAMPPRFDPDKGTTVFAPEGRGYGYWAGGQKVVFDPEKNKFYLYYRMRYPLGKGRGGKCCIAESDDGINFTNIWEATKDQLDAESMEVGSLIRDPNTGKWRLYISFQVRGGPWHIDLIEADHPKHFDVWHHRTVMEAEDFGLASIKDPAVYIIGGLYVVFVCVPAPQRWREDDSGYRHPVGDDATGIVTSPDGIYFKNFKYVFEPGQGNPEDWGCFRSRINSIIYLPPVYIGFFDGGTTAYDRYEEWCGIATSHNLEQWTRVSTNGPWIRSPYGCIRYVDALIVKNDIWYYYEWTREDGSHELRVNKVGL